MTNEIKLIIQNAKALASVLTTEPVPEQVKILSSKNAGETIKRLIKIIEGE